MSRLSLAHRWVFAAFVLPGSALAQSGRPVATPQSAGPPGYSSPSSAASPAQALFDEAKALAANRQWDEACPKLEQSQRLEPRMVTVYRLADCYEHVGRPASAWMLFLDAASQARDTGERDREKTALDRASSLERTVPRLVVNVAATPGVQVTYDGAPLSSRQWGVRVPVDPGTHTIAASAPGKVSFTVDVSTSMGRVASVSVPPLEDSETASGIPVPAVSEAHVGSVPSPVEAVAPATKSSSPSSGLILAGVITLGVGAAVVLSAGVLYGATSVPATGPCPASKCVIPALLFWPGVALAVGGGSMWLAGAATKPAVTVSLGPSSATVEGTF